ncbi:2-C-methyl-D-erythritol 4-phosphate cytidylyltransferase [bacterium]|nr:MAG: 2-C-methyl-D-erythritol 4-phosphate cytidylyltransferase [bacterium]RIK64716.1 MAG: 2-C-methyl-D-erythritol 4-phosphate cytidylyltransferase [Planctomycetota bacterium]
MSEFSLIIVAGGMGTRMQSATKKPFLEIGGRPMLEHTCRAFAGVRGIVETVIVLPPDEIARLTGAPAQSVELASVKGGGELLDTLRALGVTRFVAGGARRQDSVHNGLAACRLGEFVLVHDAARPFVRRDHVEAVMAQARQSGAAILALPVKDTLKRVDDAGRIVGTVDRKHLWAAQTPQAARRKDLLGAFARFGKEDVTDDAALLERAGIACTVVTGDAGNFKVTTPDDLVMAERMMGPRPKATSWRLSSAGRSTRPQSAIFRELPSADTIMELTPGGEAHKRTPDEAFNDAVEAARMADFTSALVFATEALELNPQWADAWSLMAGCYDQIGDHDRALRAAEQAAKSEPGKAQWWINYGFLLLGARRWQESEGAYLKALALDEKSAGAHFNVALAQANLGRRAEASRHLKRAVELRPDLAAEARKFEVFQGL